MKGDFTRGHRPDGKRNTKYRRVLMQEGRLVLDSDVAAAADAVDTALRDLASDVGCEMGSPDLGYLVTPGPLFALFETLDGVTLPAPGGAFQAYRDHGVKYLERFPSIYIDGRTGAGSVPIRGRRSLSKVDYPTLRIWARGAATVTITVEGFAVNHTFTNATAIAFYDVPIPAAAPATYRNITIGFSAASASNEVWIAMIEGYQLPQSRPHFWHTSGRYYLRGLPVEAAVDGQYPDATFPQAVGFTPQDHAPPAGTCLVAYLEGWERLVTHVEDRGILEQALGGSLDTTVRSKAVGQVKVAHVVNDGGNPAGLSGNVVSAFANIDVGTAQLDLTVAPTAINLDPCAIPEAGGYTGADNRFYRFEVHTGGALGDVLIKWSKNNGSDLFAVASIDPALQFLTLGPGAEVKDGDLVELVDETDDLGDQSVAVVNLLGQSFTPPRRAVGDLFYAETTQTAGQIKLRLTNATKDPTTVPAAFASLPAASNRKVRVWHGLVDTDPAGPDPDNNKFDLGDGIQMKLSGADFRPGDYWQYEARKLTDNDNGPWQSAPHGPERIFAPLALMQYVPGTPLRLLRWYDHQYSPLCELDADDIAYDGGKVGTDADTVQEALDELYAKGGGGCCDITLEAEGQGDDAPRIQQAIEDLPDGGTLCLQRGVFNIKSTVLVKKKRVTITGCPHTIVIGELSGGAPMFELDNDADLTLVDLLLFARSSSGPVVSMPYVQPQSGQAFTGLLTLRGVGAVHVAKDGEVIRVGSPGFPSIDPLDPKPLDVAANNFPRVAIEVEDSMLAAVWGVLGEVLARCAMKGSVLLCEKIGIFGAEESVVDLRQTTIVARFTSTVRQALEAVSVDDLEAAVVDMFEASTSTVLSGSIGLVVGSMAEGKIEGCVLGCDTAMYVGWGGGLWSTGNRYFAIDGPAVRMDSVANVRFESDELTSSSCALHLPWQGSQIDVTRCSLAGTRGMIFAADIDANELPPLFAPTFSRINIHANRIAPGHIGILWGPYFDTQQLVPPIVSTGAIVISSNTIVANKMRLAIGFAVFDPPTSVAPGQARLRIVDNQINAPAGIVAFGNDIVVQGNVVHSNATLGTTGALFGIPLAGHNRAGMIFADGERVVVQDNVIELTFDQGSPSLGIMVYEKWEEGGRYDIVIEGNFVKASTPLSLPDGEHGAGTDGLVLVDNRFEGGQSSMAQLYNSTLRGNVFRGGLVIQMGSHIVVSGNRFTETSAANGLRMLNIWGAWQVEDNRSDGSIVLWPMTSGSAEWPYEPQVIGNWASFDLVVGHPADSTISTGVATYTGATASTGTRVQVVANRAGNWLVTNLQYSQIVFAHNFAVNYAPSNWSQTVVITAPNYNAP